MSGPHDGKPFFLFLASFLPKTQHRHREVQNEFCEHLGCPGLAIFTDTETQTDVCLTHPGADLILPTETATLLWKKPHIPEHLVGRLHPLPRQNWWPNKQR
jgi:hypothetical protein